MYSNTLKKYERLSGEKKISGLFATGESGFVYPFKYHFSITECSERFLPENDLETGVKCNKSVSVPGVSILISAPKRYNKRANKRNYIKRLAREAYRQNKHQLLSKALSGRRCIEIALVYVTSEKMEFKRIEDAVGKILSNISEKF